MLEIQLLINEQDLQLTELGQQGEEEIDLMQCRNVNYSIFSIKDLFFICIFFR
jgi:hypothetical protein